MKGLRELALSCLLFGCATHAAATEIADNLLKLDPLVYFGAESFQLDEDTGLNRGQASSRLSFSSASPVTTSSLLGSHAGQALKLSGQESFELQADFLSETNLAKGMVLGFFAAPDLQPTSTAQCLLSVGSNFALTLVENSFKIYEQGESGRIVELPDLRGPDEDQSAMFLVFSTSKVEVYKGFEKVWDLTVAGGTASLAGSQIVLGDCSSEVKETLIQQGIAGYEGWLDELTVVSGDSWREFAPLELAQSTMPMPTIARAATKPQVNSWQVAGTSTPRGPKAVEQMNDSFCPVDEGDPIVDESLPDTSMTRVLLMMAGMGAYPLHAERWGNGSYALVGGTHSSFAGFVYPAATQFFPVEWNATLLLQGQEEPDSLYHAAMSDQVEVFHKGEGFFQFEAVDGAERINIDCFGASADCLDLYSRLDQGIAFGMPKSTEQVAFNLQREDLPDAYDRSLRSLNFAFSDTLTAVDATTQVLPAGLIKLYIADETGEQWTEQPIENAKASGNTLELMFNPRLKSASYRIEFDATLSSYAGVALGEVQSYAFTVASAELLVSSNTSIGQQDFQHDGKRLIVDGATLTLSGGHDYESVVVRNAGVITSPVSQRVSITADEIEVDASSRIDASAKGNLGSTAVSVYTGGSYGGSGGTTNFGASNAPYGDFREPKDLGTGGRNGGTGYTRGGGAIELQTAALKLDGRILANGSFSTGNYGSGSGGSLLLRVDQLILGEQARIEASGGGSTSSGVYGGGGGGRVALHYKELLQGSVANQLWAKGGLSNSSTGALPGGAGSIYLKNTVTEEEELLFKNTGVSTTAPMVKLDLQDQSVTYGGKLSLVNVVAQLLGEPVLAGVSGTSARLIGSYRNADDELVVDGITLELNRSGSWSNVRVVNGGVINTPLANAYTDEKISISAGEIEVDASSRIDVSARGLQGLLAASLESGGSHGGSGGVVGSGTSNAPHGDFREPRDFGTGGRSRESGSTRGGGAIELIAEVLRLDGRVLANGQALSSNNTATGYYGSGSGGSILLRVGRLALGEAATIEANGAGFASEPYRGGGGGGRVALHYGELLQGDLATQLWAKGGLASNATPGAAGSIYLRNTTTEAEELIFKNTGVPINAPSSTLDLQGEAIYSGKVSLVNSVLRVLGDAGFSEVSVTNGHMVGSYRSADNELVVDGHTLELNQSGSWSRVRVINGGVLTTPYASAHDAEKISITADEIEVDVSSRIDVSSRGMLGNSTQARQSGGSYGGQGGSSSYGVGNAPYGDYLEPREFGSGGRDHSFGYTRGGGSIELTGQLLRLEGRIVANGQAIHSSSASSAYGSGSGGSILLRVARLQLGETARIEANGGGTTASYYQGGGGGGRVALYYGELQQGNLATQLSAKGGLASSSITTVTAGAAGSIYLKNTVTQHEELVFDNSGIWKSPPFALVDLRDQEKYGGSIRLINANTLVRGDLANEQIQRTNSLLWRSHVAEGGELVVDNYRLILDANAQWSKIRVISSGVISTISASANTDQAITLSAGEIFIDATSRIDVDGAGALAPAGVGIYSGGSHGGYGGVYQSNSTNLPYGDFREPQHMGSGGVGNTTSTKVSRGGGAIEVNAELLRLDGVIRANGQSAGTSGGGGSGGSLLLHVANFELAETARIEANGGAAESSYGGGGGGRVAVYYGAVDRNLLLKAVSAKGGGGSSRPGAAGTIYLQDNLGGESELLVDNSQINTTAAAITLLDFNASGGEFDGKLTLRNANVRILGSSLVSLDVSGGATYLQVAELENLQGLNAQIIQRQDIQVTELQVTGGSWNQAGYALHADNYLFNGAVLSLSGAFNGAETDLLVNGFTLELAENRTWQKVRVINGGIITTPLEKIVSISADEIEIDSTSRIDVSSKGSLGLNGGGHAGGSYGGWGGVYSTSSTSAPYGSFQEPKSLGRGGRINGSNFTRGGGAIEIQTKLLRLDGRIYAAGQGNYSAGGGASGGSILLKADVLELGGSSYILASGGASTYAGGSGGRIAIHYREVDKNALLRALQARGGMVSNAAGQYGAAGTIYLNDLSVEQAELIVDNTSRDKARSARTSISVAEPGELAARLNAISANLELSVTKLDAVSLQDSQLTQMKPLQVAELSMIGGGWNQAGFALDVAAYQFVGGVHTMSGAFSGISDHLLVDGYTLVLDRDWTWSTVRIINGGVLTIQEALLSPTGISITADEIEVDASSKIDVSGKGLLPTAQVGNNCGGSHGGLGGRINGCTTNPIFGDYLAPTTHGIGGRYSGSVDSTRGGGAIKLLVGSFKLNGQLLANGETGTASTWQASGSGGSIWIDTQVLMGSATTRIHAKGGDGRTYGPPGGGGRIAIYYAGLQGVDALSQISIAPGIRAAGNTTAAQQGSLHIENRVVATAVANADVSGLTNKAISKITVDFINAVDPESLTPEVAVLIGPNGQVPIQAVSAVNSVRYQFELAEILPDGAYELRVGPGIRSAQGLGMDQNGNGVADEVDDVFVRTFVVDRLPPQAPVVTSPLVAPAINSLNVRKVTLKGTREEESAILLNGVVKVALGNGPWVITDHALTEGDSTLQVRVRDVAGNNSVATLLNFSVDSISPSVQQYSHSGSIRTVPTSVWVRFSEAGSGLDFANSSLILRRSGSLISGQLSLEEDVLRLTPNSTLLEGAYSVAVNLKDKAGNLVTTSYSFTLDYTKPQAPVVNAYPALTTNKQLLISGGKESYSKVYIRNSANVQLAVLGGSSSTVWQYTFTLEPGDNSFTVFQIDQAGNASSAATIQIRFDNEAPGPVTFSLDPKGSGTEVKLAWPSYSEAANGNDIQQYRIYSAAQPFTHIDQAQLLLTVPGGSKQALAKNLTRGEERYFAVVAVDQQGLLLGEVTALAATPQDIQAPAELTALAVKPTADQLNLTWQASPNSAGDLAGYALYVGAGTAQRIDLPLAALSEGLRYSLSGLSPASANPLRLVAVDNDGNESAGLLNPGITWLNNPQNLQLEPLANRFDANWAAVTPAEWVSGYRLYVADAPFTSIQGMTPKTSTTAAQLSSSVSGLLNNKTYHVVVTVVNASGGENPQVQSLSITPAADSVGPELTSLTWHSAQGAQDLRGGGELSQLGEWRLQASDESGIGRIELSLDGQPLGQASKVGSYYRYAWNLSQVADGDYELGIKLQDTLDNVSQTSVALEVALAAPAQPSLSLQSKLSTTNNAQQVLLIQGQANSLAQVSLNGDDLTELVSLNGTGQAQVPLTLVEGANQLSARLRYSSRDQFGEASAPLNVTLDTALPNAPGNLQATAKAQGIVQLSWAAVSGVAGYNLYAANQPFAAISDAGVSKLNSKALTSLSYQHQGSSDGTYYYRVSAFNALGSESALSAQQSAKVDRTAPRVEEAQYSSQGPVSADGRFGPGRVDVRLRMSEPLRNAPFFSLDVPQGVSIPVRMSQAANDPLAYQGSFDLSNAAPSGLLYARVSAHDLVSNEGTEVLEGKTLRIDTQGPELQQLSLLPESPVENRVVDNQGRELQVVLRLSEDPVALPQLTPLLDGQAVAGQSGPLQLSLDAQSQPGAPVYSGHFRLPTSAGEQAVQLLGFDYQASDDLGNVSERILGRREFQVYQGDLPPLDIPQGLSGKALAAGRVALTWNTVKEAGAYQLYRRAEADSDFTALGRVRELSFEDNLPAAGLADGVYFYQVASIREHEGKEALSLPSEPVKVQVLSQAPGAPRELSGELNGAGIVLRWLAPAAGQAVSYNLYRANVGQGQAIDISGLTPLQSKIPELIALDSRPSDTEHAYAVTAVDAAGNESAASASVYLNAGLLPVRDLSIRLQQGQAPVLQWDHSGKDVAGYNLYVGAGESAQKLNGELLTSKSYSDTNLALPFSGERLYSVTAVDAQDVESLPHALLLPAVKAELRAEQSFERGVFNQLYYRVSNSGTQELKRLRLRVDVSSGGQTKQHLSDYFNVAAGAIAEVPVVVAGYQDLPGVVPLNVDILYAPQVGEAVSIQRSESILAGENTLLVQVLADEFTRGGTGSVRLRLENPSAVATELVTARNNGNLASSEMRLILEDLQGNVLATRAVKAAVGNGLVTVRDGRTVARVGAYDVLETGPFSISVPQAAPDRVRLRLEADYLHHQTALPGELKIGGLRSSRELTLVESPYYGEISEVTPQQVQAGDSVLIRGRALSRDTAQPLAGVELKLILTVRGFEQVLTLTTDAEGAFEHRHKTTASDSGEYQLSLIHPSIQLRPQHGRFLVQGAAFSPASVNTSFPRNYEQTVTVVVEAGYDTPLNNVRLEYLQPSGTAGLPTGLKVQHSGALNLGAKQKGNLILRISGDNSAAASGLLDYRIVADGLARPIGQTRIQYSLVEAPVVIARPVARVSPLQVRTGLAREAERVEQVTLSNSGGAAMRNVRLSLVGDQGGSVPSWISLRSAGQLGDLPGGAQNPISVAFNPTAAVAEGDYYLSLRIDSDNHASLTVPMSVAVTQSGKGGVIFQVEDIYTGTLDDNGQRILGLKGAKLKLQNRNVLSTEFTATSDERGQVLLQNVPAGEYSYRISAWDHDDISGQLWIKPGVTESERVFLMSKLVTVEWSVKEITIQDRYEIILNATFKTNVPTALLMFEPLSINLPPMRKGDVFQGELTLTNYGLIRADAIRASLPSGDARARIEYLRSVPDTLEAGDVVVIPYRIVALQSFDPDDELNGAAGCWSFNYQGVVNYQSQCANGQIVPGRSNVAWSANGNSGSCGGGGGTVSGGLGGGGASGWGGWGGGGGTSGSGGTGTGFIPRPTPLGTGKQCPPPPDCESCNQAANGGAK